VEEGPARLDLGERRQVGSLNALTASRRTGGEDGNPRPGVTYSRRSYKWPGHSPGEIISFRTPGGESAQKDGDFASEQSNPSHTRWHSNALFINDNVATQIDGLAHITVGKDNHWYNGFKEVDHGGDFGVLKCDTTTILPIVARGVMLDIAAARGVDELPRTTRSRRWTWRRH
jgi:hypothetical protein